MPLVQLANDTELADASSRFMRNKEPEKESAKCLLKLCNWLANSKFPASTGWAGQRGNARKFKGEMDASLIETASGMITGQWWRKQLTGWGQFGACMIAVVHLCKDDRHFELVKKVLGDCAKENDDLHARMLVREIHSWNHSDKSEPRPTLHNTEHTLRRDVSAETKWKGIQSYLKEHTPHSTVEAALKALQSCVDTETPPSEVVALLRENMTTPPGYMSTADAKEMERVQRAKDAEEDDDFDLVSPHEEGVEGEKDSSVIDAASGSSTGPPSPVLAVGIPAAAALPLHPVVEAMVDDAVRTSPIALAPMPSVPPKKRVREEPEEPEEDDRKQQRQANWDKLTRMRGSIRDLIITYGETLHAFEYAGPDIDANVEQAYADVKPEASPPA